MYEKESQQRKLNVTPCSCSSGRDQVNDHISGLRITLCKQKNWEESNLVDRYIFWMKNVKLLEVWKYYLNIFNLISAVWSLALVWKIIYIFLSLKNNKNKNNLPNKEKKYCFYNILKMISQPCSQCNVSKVNTNKNRKRI